MTKKVVYYFKSIMYLSLIYGGQFKDKKKTKAPMIFSIFRLVEYKNSSYIGNFKIRKSIIRYYYFINEAIIYFILK